MKDERIDRNRCRANAASVRARSSGPRWKLVIAAGGTGGHISPALAVAEQIEAEDPHCRVEFICGKRPVEAEIYRKAGIEPKAMDIRPLERRWWAAPLNAWNVARATRRVRAHLRADRPRVVLGTGGYACVPVVLGAARLGIPTILHEQNAVAGRANRWLSRWVNAVACAYDEAAAAFPRDKTEVTGNPVRPEFLDGDRREALRRWELSQTLPTLLVFGGSQGARRLNQIVAEALEHLDRAANLAGLQILWSCGEGDWERLRTEIERKKHPNVTVRLVPFIREMGLAYAVADLALTRAGAMTLAELTANAVPAILVPLPGATAGHQRRNARPLVEKGAALVFEQHELDGRRLAEALISLLSDRARLRAMREASRQLGRRDATERIAQMILRFRGELA